jgi:acyl-CoA synthetase (AMP-forming)/AMP-acid ligase II
VIPGRVTPDTLVALLRDKATGRTAETAFVFVDGTGAESRRLSFNDLDREARALATVLQACCEPGEPVLLVFPPTLDFVSALFGCLYAGVIAVPVYPATKARDIPRLDRITTSAGARLALTTRTLAALSQSLIAAAPPNAAIRAVHWLAVEDVEPSNAEGWRMPAISGESFALLQYTSGSTDAPRGVTVTHANLLHNQQMIQQAFRHDSESTIVVGWLPLYHDMGLIGNVLQPLYLGCSCVLMSPLDFLQRPALWLETISRYRATTSGGPNFSYELCSRRVNADQRANLDLRSWKVAFNGAEPVRAEAIDKFCETFGPHGFRREAFYPCYGLAEATLLVTGGEQADAPKTLTVGRSELETGMVVPVEASQTGPSQTEARVLVSCGHPWLDQKLVIVDPTTRIACPPGRVGEIWLAGPSVTHGYWNDATRNEHTFQGTLADTGAGPFLRTGDLGFVHDGELFVTGRLKDVVIIRGRNHYAEDIEHTVERCNPFLRKGCGAAFSVDVDGAERIVIVQEVRHDALGGADLRIVVDDIREAVTGKHGICPHAIALVLPGTIPKTSSGKIQRHACRAKYLDQTLALSSAVPARPA